MGIMGNISVLVAVCVCVCVCVYVYVCAPFVNSVDSVQ